MPYHDPKYIRLISKVISKIKPSGGLVQLGDFVDWWQLSTFDKDPSRKNTARDDLEMYREIMIRWAYLLPDGCEYRQLAGNHEFRARRYIWGRASDIAQMVQAIPDILGFKDLNKVGRIKFRWYDIMDYRACTIGDCLLHHGYFFDRNVAVSNLNRYQQKILVGHSHRIQIAYNKDIWSVSLGHGSDEKLTNHIPAPTQWTQAFGILTEINGVCNIEVIPVYAGSCVLRGQSLSY